MKDFVDVKTTLPSSVVRGRLDDFSRRVNAAKVEYELLGPNCNSFSHQAIAELGLDRPVPPVTAPGWEDEIVLGN